MIEPDQLTLNLMRLKEIVNQRIAELQIAQQKVFVPLPISSDLSESLEIIDQSGERLITAPPRNRNDETPQPGSFIDRISRLFGLK